MLEKADLELPALIEELLSGRERRRPYFMADQAIDAIHFAALGRLPDNNLRAQLAEQINGDTRSGVLIDIGTTVYNSAEHQNRILPANIAERVLVDHSPHGEFIAMLRLFLGANGRGLLVEVGLPTPSASFSIDFLALSDWRAIVIEPSSELRSAIEARFSGTNFELIQTRVDSGAPEPPETVAHGAQAFGLASLSETDFRQSSLRSVLASANVPADFEVLAVSKAVRTAEVINDLIETSDYRPALIIAELEPPLNWTDLSQLGLGQEAAMSYKVALSMERSVFLVRI
jgi:hypothetical protein